MMMADIWHRSNITLLQQIHVWHDLSCYINLEVVV